MKSIKIFPNYIPKMAFAIHVIKDNAQFYFLAAFNVFTTLPQNTFWDELLFHTLTALEALLLPSTTTLQLQQVTVYYGVQNFTAQRLPLYIYTLYHKARTGWVVGKGSEHDHLELMVPI